jgi:hypothetical protein
MVAIKAVAHFSIPVSDVPKSSLFYDLTCYAGSPS